MQSIQTPHAPAAIGPYSQAVVAHGAGLLFTAGQIALDPATGTVIDGDVAAQTERVLQNLGAILTAAGTSWAHVVKTTVYIRHMSDFAVVNEIYGRVLGAARPARSTVEVSGLPRDVLVEIEAVAIVGR